MAISEDLFNLLNDQNWDEIIIKLTAYAVWLCVMIPTDQDPEDIAMGAITKVYEGQRKWNPDDEPDLLRYLKSVVKSMVNNDITSANSTRRKQVDDISELQVVHHDHMDEELYSRQLNEKILHDMQGDAELCLVYKALKDGYLPGEISAEYGLEIKKVQYAQRRLKRLAIKVIASFERRRYGTEKL